MKIFKYYAGFGALDFLRKVLKMEPWLCDLNHLLFVIGNPVNLVDYSCLYRNKFIFCKTYYKEIL